MASGIRPFTSDSALTSFATKFLRGRVVHFRKDTGICLTKNAQGKHAYFPALMTCISFLDLMSGLHAGKLKRNNLEQLTQYAHAFMDRSHYSNLALAILYEGFRHKIAHLAHPYVVFDTSTSKKVPGSRRRITWAVYAGDRALPIKLTPCPSGSTLKKTLTPWPVGYDHRVEISVHRLRTDAVSSIYGNSGYLQHLRSNRDARERFAQCMVEYYPP